MPPEKRDRIEDINTSLYSRNAPDIKSRRKYRTFGGKSDLPTAWQSPQQPVEEPVVLNKEYKPRSMSILAKILIASAVFCFLAVGAGAYLFFNGSNLISGDNIDIDIRGPLTVAGGSPTKFVIKVTNNNAVTLKTADLHIRFPAGATDPANTSLSLENTQKVIGDIAPGSSVTEEVTTILFGEQNLEKEIVATVTYGISGSSSVFTKEQSYSVTLSSSPVLVSAASIDKAAAGVPFDIAITVRSNSSNPLKNVLLAAAYPFGYTYISSTAKPLSADNSSWFLGDIAPGASKTITVTGKVSGEDTELRSFRFSVGSRSQSDPLVIGTAFAMTQRDISIDKPFVSVAVVVNGDATTADYVGQFGRALTVNLRWQNNVPSALANAVITAKLAGSAYDKGGVTSLDGFFRSATSEVVWSQQTSPALSELAAGESGSLSFVITPMDRGTPSAPIVNPRLTITAAASADRTAESGVLGATGEVVRTIKVPSSPKISGRIVRSEGPFTNTGPVPPRAESKTTYTVVWVVDNTVNSISNAVVRAKLPPYVSWVDQVSPSGESIQYDTNTGVVTWNVGNVGTHTAGTDRKREVRFQISLEPSVSQIGQTPVLIEEAALTAADTWTGTAVSDKQASLTTSFSTDAAYRAADAAVVAK